MAGFNQSKNQLLPSYFAVTINTNSTTRWPDSATENNGGLHVQDYSAYDTEAHPVNNDAALKIARGHLRFKFIIEELTKYSDAQIVSVGFTSSNKNNGNQRATQVKFTVLYEREDNVLPSVRDEIYQSKNNYNTYNGSEVTEIERAIKHLIVQGVTKGGTVGYTKRVNVGDSHRQVTVMQPSAPTGIFGDVTVTRLVDAEVVRP